MLRLHIKTLFRIRYHPLLFQIHYNVVYLLSIMESTLQHSDVTTFRILLKQDRNRLRRILKQSARHKKTVLVIPLLEVSLPL